MPYKDPERKRQWEREHREQRNARRRVKHLNAGTDPPTIQNSRPDLISAEDQSSAWVVGMGLVTAVLAVGFVLFAVWGKLSRSDFGTPVPAQKP